MIHWQSALASLSSNPYCEKGENEASQYRAMLKPASFDLLVFLVVSSVNEYAHRYESHHRREESHIVSFYAQFIHLPRPCVIRQWIKNELKSSALISLYTSVLSLRMPRATHPVVEEPRDFFMVYHAELDEQAILNIRSRLSLYC